MHMKFLGKSSKQTSSFGRSRSRALPAEAGKVKVTFNVDCDVVFAATSVAISADTTSRGMIGQWRVSIPASPERSNPRMAEPRI
jgi:hypothetical protein